MSNLTKILAGENGNATTGLCKYIIAQQFKFILNKGGINGPNKEGINGPIYFRL